MPSELYCDCADDRGGGYGGGGGRGGYGDRDSGGRGGYGDRDSGGRGRARSLLCPPAVLRCILRKTPHWLYTVIEAAEASMDAQQ